MKYYTVLAIRIIMILGALGIIIGIWTGVWSTPRWSLTTYVFLAAVYTADLIDKAAYTRRREIREAQVQRQLDIYMEGKDHNGTT